MRTHLAEHGAAARGAPGPGAAQQRHLTVVTTDDAASFPPDNADDADNSEPGEAA
jgi:hypothetical protein